MYRKEEANFFSSSEINSIHYISGLKRNNIYKKLRRFIPIPSSIVRVDNIIIYEKCLTIKNARSVEKKVIFILKTLCSAAPESIAVRRT